MYDATDIDGDGAIDVMSASHLDDTIAWYENDGVGGSWTYHSLIHAGGWRKLGVRH